MNDFLETLRLRLQGSLPAGEYRRWLGPVRWHCQESGNYLLLTVPTPFHQKMIVERYIGEILRQALNCGRPFSGVKFASARSRPAEAALHIIQAEAAPEKALGRPAIPDHNFESFLTFPSNHLAVKALKSFTQGYETLPVRILFLSASGPWGKSHLIDAACRSLTGSGTTVLKLGTGLPDEEQWAKAEVIMADDVHQLDQRQEIQKRLSQAFDEINTRRLRIIASAPVAPLKLQNLNDQLRSRLSSGLHLKIDPPEFDLTLELAARLAVKAGFEADPEMINALAKEAQGDPRRLGGLIASALFISVNTEFSPKEALESVIRDRTPKDGPAEPDIELIIQTVAASFALKPHDLTGHLKSRQTAWPRRVAMCLARELTGLTTTEIGKAFGGRDHSTVIHALKKINEETKNPAKARIVENIRRAIIMGEKEAAIETEDGGPPTD